MIHFNQKRRDDDNGSNGKGPRPPPRTSPPPPYDSPMRETPLPAPPMSGKDDDEIKRKPFAREKAAVAGKVKFFKKLNKVLSKAH